MCNHHVLSYCLLMQLLFIAPVHGSKKPQIPSLKINKVTNSFQNFEVLERNGETPSHAFELKKTRLENVVQRPTKPGSKVHLPKLYFLKPHWLERFVCLKIC